MSRIRPRCRAAGDRISEARSYEGVIRMMSVSISQTHSAVGWRWKASATAGILDHV